MTTYTCAMCRGIFEKSRTDEEAWEEFQSVFGKSMRPEECDLVCEECYRRLDPANNPHLVEEAVDQHARERRPDGRAG